MPLLSSCEYNYKRWSMFLVEENEYEYKYEYEQLYSKGDAMIYVRV